MVALVNSTAAGRTFGGGISTCSTASFARIAGVVDIGVTSWTVSHTLAIQEEG